MTKFARYLFGNEDAVQLTNRKIDGERWYMASIICQILGMSNHSVAVHGFRYTDPYELDCDEWRKEKIYTGSANRQVLLVNTSGMLKIIFQGKTAKAREAQERARRTPAELRTSETDEWPTWLAATGNDALADTATVAVAE